MVDAEGYPCKEMKRHEAIHYEYFHSRYFSKISMLIIENIYLCLYFFHIITVSLSLPFHKCHVICPYPNLCCVRASLDDKISTCYNTIFITK